MLGWPLVRDQNEETAIRAPDLTGPMITWGGILRNPKLGKNRPHFDWIVMADPDDNEFCVLTPR